MRDNEGFFVDPKNATSLAAILKGQGYRTAAFVSAFVLDSRWGLDQGFDTYFDDFDQFREVNRDDVQRKAEETASEVERWLHANKDTPFFCWVHFYDPHEPYDPPGAVRLDVRRQPVRRRDRLHGSVDREADGDVGRA